MICMGDEFQHQWNGALNLSRIIYKASREFYVFFISNDSDMKRFSLTFIPDVLHILQVCTKCGCWSDISVPPISITPAGVFCHQVIHKVFKECNVFVAADFHQFLSQILTIAKNKWKYSVTIEKTENIFFNIRKGFSYIIIAPKWAKWFLIMYLLGEFIHFVNIVLPLQVLVIYWSSPFWRATILVLFECSIS